MISRCRAARSCTMTRPWAMRGTSWAASPALPGIQGHGKPARTRSVRNGKGRVEYHRAPRHAGYWETTGTSVLAQRAGVVSAADVHQAGSPTHADVAHFLKIFRKLHSPSPAL